MSRPFVRKWDGVWISLLVLLALGGWFWFQLRSSPDVVWARVFVGSQEILHLNLKQEPKRMVTLPEGIPVVLELDGEGGIAFHSSNCPDQICVHSGWLRHPGEAAACLPNRIFVRLEGSGGSNPDQPDIVVGGDK